MDTSWNGSSAATSRAESVSSVAAVSSASSVRAKRNISGLNASGLLASSPSGLVREGESAEQLRAAEADILAQERAKESQGSVKSVRYTYTVGPDGQRYVTGAVLTIRKRADGSPATESAREQDTEGGTISEESTGTEEAIRELERIDAEVRTHEAAHQARGGRFAGAATFTYTTGPDGKRYAVGGQVPINVPAGLSPEETIAAMEQVRAAAMSPSDPSGADLSVAANASASVARASSELARKRAQTSYGEQQRFSDAVSVAPRLSSEEGAGAVSAEEISAEEELSKSKSPAGSVLEGLEKLSYSTPEGVLIPNPYRRPGSVLDLAA
jgi:hypothetical protein